MTATLFTDYLGSNVLPTEAGHISWGSGFTTASSVVLQMSKPNSSADTFTFTTAGMTMMANGLRSRQNLCMAKSILWI